MIVSREAVRAAVNRALVLDPCEESAIHAVAQATGLPPELVREAVQEVEAAS